MKKTYRIKTNNQELLIRKQNESDATSRWIEFQKKREDLMFGRKAQILRRHYMNFSSLPDMRSFEDFSKYYVSTSLEEFIFWICSWRGSFSFIFNSHFFFVVLEFFIFFIFIFYLLIILWGIQQIIKCHFYLSFFKKISLVSF